MEDFTETHSKQLLATEWLVKVNGLNSVPYLLKFNFSEPDSMCCVLITDTRRVWYEVLPAERVLRRLRECNPGNNPYLEAPDSDLSRSKTLELIGSLHTMEGIPDVSFDIIESRDADLAVELVFEGFKWRWYTYRLGPNTSADVLSKHLIIPLISTVHLSFSSADPVSDLSSDDLEKSVDRVGKVARRSFDVHIKHAISRPQVTTSLRRFAALYNFEASLPSVVTDLPDSSCDTLLAGLKTCLHTTQRDHDIRNFPPTSQTANGYAQSLDKVRVMGGSTETTDVIATNTRQPLPPGAEASSSKVHESESVQAKPGGGDDGSTTEDSDFDVHNAEAPPKSTGDSFRPSAKERIAPPNDGPARHDPASVGERHVQQLSSPESSPPRPVKKLKPLESRKSAIDSSDSDENSKARSSASRAGSSAPAVRGSSSVRGVRQPLKRGAKRF